MNKPNNYENTQVSGDYIPVELGGHYATIKNVAERETKNGDPMIVVSIDFDKKDRQPGYFTDMFKKDVRPDKKWPNQATNYITTEYGGACTKGFKSFIKAYADSNGLTEDQIKWGSDFAAQFKNKRIGVVFGNVEETYNGKTGLRRKIRWFCGYDNVSKQNIPADKLENGGQKAQSDIPIDTFVNVSDDDEDLPFNV
ncbi:MAG: hypothetical protein IIY21_24080 [Clostridiales bacterium]|nr:hypothetical protein [Clostridiales bacterium]